MTKIEYQEYVQNAHDRFRRFKDHPPDAFGSERIGQSFFNELSDTHPDIADEIRGSLYDPFHDDALLGTFLVHIHTSYVKEDS